MAPLGSTRGDTDQVLIDKNLFVRTLVLNRPRQLNALSSQMVICCGVVFCMPMQLPGTLSNAYMSLHFVNMPRACKWL
uniref:Uncharacterized protein n=1 Tax=Vitis vinifera TaxID=29760 RepID=F6HXF1_VITVI